MRTTSILLAIALGLTLAACSNDNSGKKAEPAKATPAAPATKPAAAAPAPKLPPDSPEAVAAVAAVMAPYQACQSALAADKTDGIAEAAGKLAAAATAGEKAVPEAARQPLTDLAKAAGDLASAKTDDIAAVRMAFGEVSKHMVAMLAAMPATAAEYHVFQCPMVEKGYNRWVQTAAKTSNPYQGAKMSTCGTEVHDLHAAMMGGQGMQGMQGHGMQGQGMQGQGMQGMHGGQMNKTP